MNLTQISAADLKGIGKLLRKKEILLAGIAKIDAQLTQYGSSQPAGQVGLQGGVVRGAKRAKRGAVKAAIIGALKEAGKAGITVKDLSTNLGLKYNHVFTWFYNSGKRIKEIKKVGEARYGWIA